MINILIVGMGNVGRHILNEFSQYRNEVNIEMFDKYKQIYNSKIDNKSFDFSFICVPTEMNEDGSCNVSEVICAVNDLRARCNPGIIVLKSTVPIGTTESLGSDVIFSPEYYGTTLHSPKNVNFLILGGNKENCSKVADLYYRIKPNSFRIRFTDSRTAELAKYMENCFLALKVTFCSEFAMIAREFGISYPELREIFIMDERMGDSHTLIKEDQPFYDSHCLNKDIPALNRQTKLSLLMRAVEEINKQMKSNKSLDN